MKDIEEKRKCIPKSVDKSNWGRRVIETQKTKLETTLSKVHAPFRLGLIRPGSTGTYPAEFRVS